MRTVSKREYGLFERFDYVSGANNPIFENVRSEPTSVGKCLQYAILTDALKMITGFTQSISSTDGITDSESLSNEMIECDITSFDISPVFSRCEFDCCYSLLLDQREVVPIVVFFIWLPPDKGSCLNLAKVAVTSEPLSGNCFNAVLPSLLRLQVR